LTVTQTVQLTFSRSLGPNVSSSFTFAGPGIIITEGSSPGTYSVPPGDYTLQFLVNGFGSIPSGASFAVTLGVPPTSQTAFTYQGKLTRTNGALPTAIDMSVSFFNASVGGTVFAAPQAVSNVPVASDGTFTVQLDPGVNFPLGDTWLDIAIRPTGGGAFTNLSPRQQVTAAPKARAADTANVALAARWLDSLQPIFVRGEAGLSSQSPGMTLVSGNLQRAFVGMRDDTTVGFRSESTGAWMLAANTQTGFVGIGTTNPQFNVHTVGTTDVQIAATSTSSGGRTWSVQSSSGTYGPGNQLNGSFQIVDRTSNVARMLIDASGNMGVGTTQPQSRLQVGGTVRADAFAYTTPVSTTVTIGEMAWRSRSGAAVSMGLGQGGAVLASGDPSGLIAQLPVPVGATITGVTIYVVDNEPGVNLQVTTIRADPTSLAGIVQLSVASFTTGAALAVVPINATPTTTQLASTNQVYYVQVLPVIGNWTGNLSVRGATVTYTTPRPLP
ncbi:MAG: hypothetical protein MUE97_05635, partial [Phycisphaerales bacterium]|nr:hypothetical protein [Phycisphaerales bacterium]